MTALATKVQLELATRTGHSPGPSVTVVENPSLDHCIGFLFAKHFYGHPLNRFKDMLYVRMDVQKLEVSEKTRFHEANIKRVSLNESGYQYILTDQEKTLRAGTVRPYEVCHIPLDSYRQLANEHSWERYPQDVLESTYAMLDRYSALFRMTSDGLLIPTDYAAVRM